MSKAKNYTNGMALSDLRTNLSTEPVDYAANISLVRDLGHREVV
jgi:hypothetical protein